MSSKKDTSSKEKRIETILKMIGSGPGQEQKALAAMLLSIEKGKDPEQLYKDYAELMEISKKQVPVEVVSAIKLDDEILGNIKKAMDRRTGEDTRIINIVDDSIIGGLVIKIKDTLIDLSIKKKLGDLRLVLKDLELRGKEFGTEN